MWGAAWTPSGEDPVSPETCRGCLRFAQLKLWETQVEPWGSSDRAGQDGWRRTSVCVPGLLQGCGEVAEVDL